MMVRMSGLFEAWMEKPFSFSKKRLKISYLRRSRQHCMGLLSNWSEKMDEMESYK